MTEKGLEIMMYKLYGSVALTFVLNIILPTSDTVLEIVLIRKLVQREYPQWAGCLLIPMLLNYIFLFITWKVTTKHARWSWYWWVDLVSLALQIWPQYRVGRIIWYRLKHDLVFEEEEKMYNEETFNR